MCFRFANGWLGIILQEEVRPLPEAGAVRYRLPDNLPPTTLATTYTYGYLLGTVNSNGAIAFHFHQVTEDDVLPHIKTKYGNDFVHFCFLANRDDTPHVPEQSCNEQ